MPRSARGTTGATRWRPSCSTSTTTARPSSSATARWRRISRRRRGWPWPTARSTPSASTTRHTSGDDMSEHTDVAPASIYGPVEDWATDIDHADPAYNPRAPEIWAELRAAGCPVAHTERYHGMWAPVTAELVRQIAYDTDNYTSRAVVVSTAAI